MDFLRALGLTPEKTRKVTIEFAVDAITVTVTESYTSIEDIEKLTETVREFNLIPKKKRS